MKSIGKSFVKTNFLSREIYFSNYVITYMPIGSRFTAETISSNVCDDVSIFLSMNVTYFLLFFLLGFMSRDFSTYPRKGYLMITCILETLFLSITYRGTRLPTWIAAAIDSNCNFIFLVYHSLLSCFLFLILSKRLTGYENTIFGQRPCLQKFLRQRITKRTHMDMWDVLCFGHLVFEMATGHQVIKIYCKHIDRFLKNRLSCYFIFLSVAFIYAWKYRALSCVITKLMIAMIKLVFNYFNNIMC